MTNLDLPVDEKLSRSFEHCLKSIINGYQHCLQITIHAKFHGRKSVQRNLTCNTRERKTRDFYTIQSGCPQN